jgi:hypothetical protein
MSYHFEIQDPGGEFRRTTWHADDPEAAEPFRLALEAAMHRPVRVVPDEPAPVPNPLQVLAALNGRSGE